MLNNVHISRCYEVGLLSKIEIDIWTIYGNHLFIYLFFLGGGVQICALI